MAVPEQGGQERTRANAWAGPSRKGPIKFERVKGSTCRVRVDTNDQLWPIKMLDALGTDNPQLQSFLIDQVVASFPGAGPTEHRDPGVVVKAANTAAAILAGIHPRDEIEGMMVVQMIAVHNMAMEAMKLAMLPDQTLLHKDSCVSCATKMLRTFTAQVEALRRHRGGGEQKMTVEHVHVNQGGQAIVGSIGVNGLQNQEKCG